MNGSYILMFEGKSALVKLNRKRVEDLNGIAIEILAVLNHLDIEKLTDIINEI